MKGNSVRRSARTEIRIAKALFIMVTAFLLSMLPTTARLLWVHLDPSALETDSWKKHKLYTDYYHVSTVLAFYNSFWNYFIYQARDKDFKKSLKKLKNSVSSNFCKSGKNGIVNRNKKVKPNEVLSRKTVATEV